MRQGLGGEMMLWIDVDLVLICFFFRDLFCYVHPLEKSGLTICPKCCWFAMKRPGDMRKRRRLRRNWMLTVCSPSRWDWNILLTGSKLHTF